MASYFYPNAGRQLAPSDVGSAYTASFTSTAPRPSPNDGPTIRTAWQLSLRIDLQCDLGLREARLMGGTRRVLKNVVSRTVMTRSVRSERPPRPAAPADAKPLAQHKFGRNITAIPLCLRMRPSAPRYSSHSTTRSTSGRLSSRANAAHRRSQKDES